MSAQPRLTLQYDFPLPPGLDAGGFLQFSNALHTAARAHGLELLPGNAIAGFPVSHIVDREIVLTGYENLDAFLAWSLSRLWPQVLHGWVDSRAAYDNLRIVSGLWPHNPSGVAVGMLILGPGAGGGETSFRLTFLAGVVASSRWARLETFVDEIQRAHSEMFDRF